MSLAAVLPELRTALADHGRAVLAAPPGAGKTTRVPLDLLAHGAPTGIVLLEPRRVAARAAAARLAAGLGEPVGGTVGLTTRDERRVSARTRLEVVTEGVLLRRLQRDPALPGVGTVILDEFHERSLVADLSLAFTREVQTTLRPDLWVLVTSATLQVDRVSALLDGAPVCVADHVGHPVDVEHRPRPADLTAGVVAAVAEALDRRDGDVLVFLPGAAEIERARRAVTEDLRRAGRPDVEVLPLHGRLPPAAQDRALSRRPGRRKVVLATDLAESSLTIEGVTVVVDAGLVREPRFDATTEMTGLVTGPASRAAATQRAGRAGRTGPGLCLRLWPGSERRDPHPRPAIASDDLTAAALEVTAWGTDVDALALLDPPPARGWARARQTLAELGAVADDGRVTAHGRALVDLPVHPRLGQLLLTGRDRGLGPLACEVAAVLTGRELLLGVPDAPAVSCELGLRVRALREGVAPPGATVQPGARRAARREVRRLARHLGVHADARQDLDDIGVLVQAGWPAWVAAARDGQRGRFLLAAGRGATLPAGDPLAGEPLLAVAHLDRGATQARIHLAAPLDLDELPVDRTGMVRWEDGEVVARRLTTHGALVLRSDPWPDPPADEVQAALRTGLTSEGLELLGIDAAATQLRARLALLHRTLGPPWPAVDDASLLAAVEPFLPGCRRRADLARIRLADVLGSRLPPGAAGRLDTLAPTHLRVPSGSRIRVDYTVDPPVLAVRLQELFGATETPTLVGGRVSVVMHLLSPAGRPVQVTRDLAGFWERTYPTVRAELRGRYPRHAWPEDPRQAVALRGTPRRRLR